MNDAAGLPADAREPLLHLGHPDHHVPGYELPETASPPPSRRTCISGFLIASLIGVAGYLLKHFSEGAAIPAITLPWLLPFILLLLCIAVAPFALKHFWEKYYAVVSIALGLLVTLYYCFALAHPRIMAETFSDYISFIFLLASLFIVSGGVIIRVRRSASPAVNTALLLAGGVLANVFGTTGAAMLLIRPYMRLNKGRMRPYHVVFFIFIVANVGGALTPVGDPPLFLGYLKGVPFWWVMQHCWAIWLTAIACLAAIFFVIDSYHASNAPRTKTPDRAAGSIISIMGAANLLFILLILVGVFLPSPLREILMAAAAFGSLALTSPRIYGENHFHHAPIKEVALLFLGIFATMVPAMNYFHNHAADPAFKRYLNTPGQFYFSCGALSSVLDNAPTYITFLQTGLAKNPGHAPIIAREKAVIAARRLQLLPADLAGLDPAQTRTLQQLHATLLHYHADQITNGTLEDGEIELGFMLDHSATLTDGNHAMFLFLIAISMGAVFFGACTYIGNGPNFMVKSIADHAGIKTPTFFGYILIYTLPILLPVLILCWLLFLRF